MLRALLATAAVTAVVSLRSGADPRSVEEATYLLQAESLARDFDRVWGPEDRSRYAAGRLEPLVWPLAPEVFARPPVYSLLVAPWVRIAGVRGAALANAVLLALAALLAVRVLAQRLGDSAAWLVTLAVFASVLWTDVFLAQPEILLLAASVSAFALAYGREGPAKERLEEIYRADDRGMGSLLRWGSVGCLLALPILHHPLYLLLLLPAGVAIPESRRRSGLAALTAGALVVLLAAGIVDRVASGSWVPSGWRVLSVVAELGEGASSAPSGESAAAAEAIRPGFDARVMGWNLVYLLAGRNVGILPYFLPVLVLLGAWRGGARRSTLVIVVFASAALFAWVEPFNFFGGPGAIANRWFVPLYGALWFVPTRPVPRRWMGLAAVAGAAFVWPLWMPPGGEPLAPGGLYRHSSGPVSRWLPYETTQQALASGGESRRGRLWIRAVSGSRVIDGRRGEFELRGGARTELLLAVPRPLESLFLEFGARAKPEIEVERGELGGTVLRPSGGVGFVILAPTPRARHRMWWTDTTQYLYLFDFRIPDARATAIRYKVTGLTRKRLENSP